MLRRCLSLRARACSTVSQPPSPPSEVKTAAASAETEANRSLAERVFLYQRRVAYSLLDRYPLMEIFAEADPALIAAEAHMTRSCSPLTQAVLQHFEGERPSLALRFRVFTTIGECERAARHIDRLLNHELADNSTI